LIFSSFTILERSTIPFELVPYREIWNEKEWHNYLGNATIADAMMDRLIYAAHRIEMKGESMRKVMAKK
jgi:hypothetical protein